MPASPQVSVLLTAYNRERYIAAAIESVLGQIFADFELVVVDDASSDATVEVARRYSRDPRVRVVVNERNLGDYGNRNRAASLARASLLKFHDSDDLMYPHCLQVMVEPLLAEPRADFALSWGRAWDGGPCPMLLNPRQCYQREFLGSGMFAAGPPSALFRREFFSSMGGYPEQGVASDYLFWLAACRTAHVLLLPADLFWYRVHPDQALTSPPAARDYAATWGAAWRALAHPRCPLEGPELRQARINWTYSLCKHNFRDLRMGRPALALHRLRHSGMRLRDWLTYLRRPRRDRWAGTPSPGPSQCLVLGGEGETGSGSAGPG